MNLRITDHRTREGKVDCAVVLDAFSRRVVGWPLPSREFKVLADLLGQPDEDPLTASDVTEPILILVLRQFTDQLGSVRAEPGERMSRSSTANMTRR